MSDLLTVKQTLREAIKNTGTAITTFVKEACIVDTVEMIEECTTAAIRASEQEARLIMALSVLEDDDIYQVLVAHNLLNQKGLIFIPTVTK